MDALGQAAPHRPLRLDLRAGHVAGATAPDRIDAMQLWLSVDGGGTWQQASTRRTGTASFSAMLPGGTLRSGDVVSLRAVATDAADNQVDQTVLGIVPVR